MTIRFSLASLGALLRSLPAIRFALMLGGGLVATALAAWIIWTVSHGGWPEAVAPARIDALKWFGLAALGLIAVVLITLAWGKAGAVRIEAGPVKAEIDMDDDQ